MESRSEPAIPDPFQPRRLNTVRRADVAPGECLCNYCSGKCCKYFSLPIETPRRWDDFDTIHRYLQHGSTLIYVEKKTWYLVVMTRCQYLMKDNRCQIYWGRPKICREYTTADCEYDDDWIFEQVFETPDQLRDYAEAILPGRRSLMPDDPTSPGGFSLAIETPTTWDDFDAIRWYLAHGLTRISVKARVWSLHISEDVEDEEFDRVFATPEQIWEYAEAILAARRPKRSEPALTVMTPPSRGSTP